MRSRRRRQVHLTYRGHLNRAGRRKLRMVLAVEHRYLGVLFQAMVRVYNDEYRRFPAPFQGCS